MCSTRTYHQKDISYDILHKISQVGWENQVLISKAINFILFKQDECVLEAKFESSVIGKIYRNHVGYQEISQIRTFISDEIISKLWILDEQLV